MADIISPASHAKSHIGWLAEELTLVMRGGVGNRSHHLEEAERHLTDLNFHMAELRAAVSLLEAA